MREEKLEFTRPQLILGNLGLLGWVFLAFLGIFFYNQIYGWLSFLLEAASIYLILRWLGCSSCYKCKTCTNGFGRLVGTFFGKGFTKKESIGNRLGIVSFAYVLLLPIPIAALFVSLLGVFSVFKLLALICLLIVTAYSLSSWYDRTNVEQQPIGNDLGEVLND